MCGRNNFMTNKELIQTLQRMPKESLVSIYGFVEKDGIQSGRGTLWVDGFRIKI